MRIRLLNVLLLAALALAASRLWLFLREPPPSLPAVGTASPAPAVPPRESPAAMPEFKPEPYDVIVARDVFSPARGVVPPEPPPAARAPEKPQPPPKVTLYGVVILDGEKSAYLHEGAQDGRPRKIREGEQFAGGVVKSIRPDGVTFLYSGNEIAIPLRTPKDGVAVAPPSIPAAVGGVQRPATPAPVPRRPSQPGVPQVRQPAPVRQTLPATTTPRFMPPAEPAIEEAGGEEYFPEEGGDEADSLDTGDEELEE